jgi:hypothetical protein
MSLRDRLVRALGGDEPVPATGVVEAAVVELWQSELVATALRDGGVPCEVAPLSAPPGNSEHVRPMARIFVPGERLAEARHMIDELTAR